MDAGRAGGVDVGLDDHRPVTDRHVFEPWEGIDRRGDVPDRGEVSRRLALQRGVAVIVLTGRPERDRANTERDEGASCAFASTPKKATPFFS